MLAITSKTGQTAMIRAAEFSTVAKLTAVAQSCARLCEYQFFHCIFAEETLLTLDKLERITVRSFVNLKLPMLS